MCNEAIRRGWLCALTGRAVLLGLLSLGVFVNPVAAEDSEWSIYAGRWAIEQEDATNEVGFELHRPFKETPFDLAGGMAATADEAVWAYVGTSVSWQAGEKFRLRPGFAVSLFEDGDGRDLGGVVEFRSSLEVTYLVNPNLRLGLLVYHLSNASIYENNPGANSLVFVVGLPR